jgi:hypothetical protein
VSVVAEVALAVFGGWQMWEAARAGQPPSRPARIAFWAGLVGLVMSVVAPRVVAYVRRRRGQPTTG